MTKTYNLIVVKTAYFFCRKNKYSEKIKKYSKSENNVQFKQVYMNKKLKIRKII